MELQGRRKLAELRGRMLPKALFVFLLAVWLPPAIPAATIILVRHAERSSTMSADSLLSPAGEERARQLSQILKDSKIGRIYVTEVRRTRQTAEPIAALLHLKPVVVAQKDTDALVRELRRLGDDETVLVVGHADTVPLIIDRLGGGSVPPLADTEYDRLTVLSIGARGEAHVLTLRYGNIAQ
jgi:broad specificity phosphatase PhoE